MKNYKSNYFRKISSFTFLVIILLFSLGATTNTSKKGKYNTIKKVLAGGDFFFFDINNLRIPVDNKGVIADVNPGDPTNQYGRYEEGTFLYSSGFFVSGLDDDGVVFSSGVLSASRIEDYQPGPVGSNKNDSKNGIYVVTQQDQAFGEEWQEWKDAVSIGADFYDGDGDGVYNPVDRNGNGTWDPDEDRPDILGDVTAWSVYNDGLPSALRRWSVNPKGIEIHQSVFGFKAKSIVGNLMFVRYRLKNTGTEVDNMTEVYFSAAADPDLGDPQDDLVGSDVDISAGYVYNREPDSEYGDKTPCFLMDFFQGPYVYIAGETYTDVDGDGIYTDGVDTPLDTAYAVRGPQIGIDEYPGAKNLPLTSMTQYMQSHVTHGDPDTHLEARNYMIGGLGKAGDSLYISAWTNGNGAELGADTVSIPSHFMYSGDPDAGTGWLNTVPDDQRQMMNTGPFTLAAGEHQDIYVAYVVGRGESSVNSVTVAKEIDKTAQIIFDNNFPAPPPPAPIVFNVESGDGFIDITWETDQLISYDVEDTVLIIRKKFEGFYLMGFNQPTKQLTVNGSINAKELISYDLDNIIESIYSVDKDGNTNLIRKVSDNPLDSLLYADPATGRMKYRITSHPITGADLVPGHEYYFAIGQYALNHLAVVNKETGVYGAKGDYIDPTNSAYSEFEEPLYTITYGIDGNNPALVGGDGAKTSGASDGEVKFVVVNKEELTGDEYSVEFFQNRDSVNYQVFWKLENSTTGEVLIDSSINFNYDSDNIASEITEGFIAKVKAASPKITNVENQRDAFITAENWAEVFNRAEKTGAYYVGEDMYPDMVNEELSSPVGNPAFPGKESNFITAGDLRNIELKFGETSMAYRYLSGYVGPRRTQLPNYYYYAEAVSSADTVGKGVVGVWDEANDNAVGLIEVPFSAYITDENFGENKKLAIAYIEAAPNSRIAAQVNPYGRPDGIWDPLDRVDKSKEFIIIFDADYDETGSNMIYTGGFDDGSGDIVWADVVNGYTVPTGTVSEEDSLLAASPFLNAMYVVNIHRTEHPDSTDNALFWSDGDQLTISMDSYPYTNKDAYTFTTRENGSLTEDELQKNFDKVNVFPNPLFAYNTQTSYDKNMNPDDPFVTFSHLPEDAVVSIYSLSGSLLRTLDSFDKTSPSSTFLRWDLKNESELRVASGLYIALVESEQYGQKVLKFSVILPQKQLQKF